MYAYGFMFLYNGVSIGMHAAIKSKYSSVYSWEMMTSSSIATVIVIAKTSAAGMYLCICMCFVCKLVSACCTT